MIVNLIKGAQFLVVDGNMNNILNNKRLSASTLIPYSPKRECGINYRKEFVFYDFLPWVMGHGK